jgi:pyruvate/2-oxoglutarate dehydrogenase complex dihydrolipoamide acyltransferase (E2) component
VEATGGRSCPNSSSDAAEGEPQREPEHEHRRRLIERDRLEEPVRRQQDWRERDERGRERLRLATAAELPGDQRREHDRRRAGEDREATEADERPAEQQARRRREERRHGRELHVPALQMPARHRVVELVALPAVPPGERQGETALQEQHEEQRRDRERGQPTRRGVLVESFRSADGAHEITGGASRLLCGRSTVGNPHPWRVAATG